MACQDRRRLRVRSKANELLGYPPKPYDGKVVRVDQRLTGPELAGLIAHIFTEVGGKLAPDIRSRAIVILYEGDKLDRVREIVTAHDNTPD